MEYLMPREEFVAEYLAAGGSPEAVDPAKVQFYAILNYMVTNQRARFANHLFHSGTRNSIVMANAGFDSYYRGSRLLARMMQDVGVPGVAAQEKICRCRGSMVMATDFDRIAERVRNWGRWGEFDQRGTINHITPEVLKRASGSVRQGKLFALGLNFDRNGPQLNVRRFNPQLYVTDIATPTNPSKPNAMYSDDVIHMPLQAATQWDALAHVHYGKTLYGGHAAHDHLSCNGTTHAGIEHLAQPGILSRGVLLDIARLLGVERLPRGHAVTVDELNRAVERQGVQILPGDVVLVRTGHMRHFTVDKSRAAYNGGQPGVDLTVAEWLYDKSAAAIAADNSAVEVIAPGMAELDMPLPFHNAAIRDMGMPLGEMFDMEALAADCESDGQYDFLFSAPPLAVTGAFGSPINPLALK
jgi:kynurenine formamidase